MEKTKWYQKVWFKYSAALVVITGLSTGGSYLLSWADWWNTQNSLPAKIKNVSKKADAILKADSIMEETFNRRLLIIEAYIHNKKNSRAVGFRVKKDVNENTGEEYWRKQYRDWGGTWHNIHLDIDMSEVYGFDCYYYIDNNHEKIYCW